MKLYVSGSTESTVWVRDPEAYTDARHVSGSLNQICALRALVAANDLFMQSVQLRGSRMTDLLNAETTEPEPLVVTRGLRLDDGRVFDVESSCVAQHDYTRASYHLRASVLTTPLAEARTQVQTLMRGTDRVLVLCDTVSVSVWRTLALDGRKRAAEVNVVRSQRNENPDARIQIATWTALRTGFMVNQYDFGFDRIFIADPLCAPAKMPYNIRANKWTWIVSDGLELDTCPAHALLVLRLLHVNDDSPQLLSQVQRLTVGILSTPRLTPVRPQLVAAESTSGSFPLLCERTIVGENPRFITANNLDGVNEDQRDNVRNALFGPEPPESCSICMSEPVNVATSCGHTFCNTCIQRVVGPCPICRSPCFEIFSSTRCVPSKIQWLRASMVAGSRTLVLVYPSYINAVHTALEPDVPKQSLCRLVGASRTRAGRLLMTAKSFTVVASMLERADLDLSRVERVLMMHTGTPNEVYRWSTRLPGSARVLMGVSRDCGDHVRLSSLTGLVFPSVHFS